MRRLLTCLGLMGLAIVGQQVWGQGPPMTATPALNPTVMTILPGQVDVFSKPSSYPTSQLRSGDRVVVLGRSTQFEGWVKILPPQGSFSYIDARYVRTFPGMDKIGVVFAVDPSGTAPVMAGSNLNREPNSVSATVKLGTQVVWVAPNGSALVIDSTGKEEMSDTDIDALFVRK